MQEASTVAEAGTRLTGNIFSAWKLHGDIKVPPGNGVYYIFSSQALQYK